MLKTVLGVLIKFVAWLPLPVVHGLGRFIGFLFGRVARHHRVEAFAQLERSMPELSPSEVKRIINTMYRYQGVNGVEMIWYSTRGLETVDAAVEVEGMEHFEAARERGKGVLALTGHVGNYELMPMATATKGYKISAVVKRIKNEAVNEVVEALRSHDGLTFLSTKNVYKDCLKALRRNEIVGMIIDQNMTREEGVFVDFFGEPACTTPGLAYMSAQSRAPVVPAFIYRKPGGGFVLRIHPLMEPPADRSPSATHEATQRYTQAVEDAVRAAPEQWIWMHRRWKTRPTEGAEGVERFKS